MTGFWIAIQFLTRLPTPPVKRDTERFARSMIWFPAAGLVIGLLVAGAGWAGTGIDSWIGALAALLAWVGVTGGLHLDGLADLADARGAAHRDRARFLAVLADPHIGSHGAIALLLQLLTKLLLLHALFDRASFLPLILLPFAARIGPIAWTLALPPLHAGLAAHFHAAVGKRHLLIWAAILLGAMRAVPGLIAAPLLIFGWSYWLRRHVGGISGDCHGAGIELIESGLLISLLLSISL